MWIQIRLNQNLEHILILKNPEMSADFLKLLRLWPLDDSGSHMGFRVWCRFIYHELEEISTFLQLILDAVCRFRDKWVIECWDVYWLSSSRDMVTILSNFIVLFLLYSMLKAFIMINLTMSCRVITMLCLDVNNARS